MDKILFSPIGGSDPIRNFHDGAMLHIVRNEKPFKVILFLTKEVSDIEKIEGRYSKSILKVNPECQIEFIHTDIINAHEYDEYIGRFQLQLRKIHEKNIDCMILVNISSGTPQIKNALCMESLNCEFPIEILQVVDPFPRIDKNRNSDMNLFNLDDAFDTNFDHEDSESPNRILKPRIMIIRKNNISHQIEALIENYQYVAALQIYKKNNTLFYELEEPNKKLKFLLEHASDRINLKLLENSKKVSSYNDKDIYPINSKDNKDEYYLTEYLSLIKIKVLNGELPEFLLKMTPYVYELTIYYFKNILKFPLIKITNINKKDNTIRLIESKLKENDIELYSFIKNKYNDNFHDYSPLNLITMIYIIEYLLSIKDEKISNKNLYSKLDFFKLDIEIYELLLMLRKFEEKLRNGAAHTIKSIEEDDIRNVSKEMQKDGFSKIKDSKSLLKDLETLTDLILSSKLKNKKIVFIYDELNALIKQEL